MEERNYPIEVIPEEVRTPTRDPQETVKHFLGVPHPPEAVLQEAQKAAKALEKVVAGKKRPVIFRGEQYLEFEDWQTVAKFYGLCARTLEAEPVEIFGVKGAKAKAEVIDLRTGQVVGGAEAYCMRDEENWKEKPWFQLASMAQTRAGAKALRNVLAWVVVLAGYRPTPAEEIQEEPAQPTQGKGTGGFSQGGGTAQAKGSLKASSSSQAGSSPQANESKADNHSVGPSNGEKTAPSHLPLSSQEERPTKEEIQNLLRLALKNGFSTVNSAGKRCVDYPRLGEFLRSNGFPRMIKEMSRNECQKASLFLESRLRTLILKEIESVLPQ